MAHRNVIIPDMPMRDYHAMQALSASGIWSLADINQGCPAKFWLASPWNPNREPINAPHFDVGKAAHLAVLEPEKVDREVVLHGFDEYRSDAAKAARDNAHAAGKIPLKPEEWAMVEEMRDAILADPLARGAFTGEGQSEVTATWIDPNFGVSCKARADRVIECGAALVDLKTASSAHPIGWSKAIWDHGYFSRAAWYLDGFEIATGKRPQEYWFVVVEKKRPWLTAVHKLEQKDIDWGAMVNQIAVAQFADCMARGEWPGYRPHGANRSRAFVTGLPKWAQYQLQDLSEAGRLVTPDGVTLDAVKRAAQLYAPDVEKEFVP